jgi:sortase A
VWPVTDHASADERNDDVDSSAHGHDGTVDGGERRRERVSRWDRPPEPHDWRFYVGTLGKVMIATGLLMFGFVAYQLWGTGIETARAQSRLEDRFAAILAEQAADTDDGSDVDVDQDDDVDDVDRDDDDGDVGDAGAPPTTGSPTDTTGATAGPSDDDTGGIDDEVPVAIDLSDEAVEQDPIPQPFRGEPLLRLEIPAIDVDDIVVPGVHLDDLKDGPGHYPDTPLPGQLGNAAIAGHRTTYGAPFFDVDRLEAGDEIITTLLNGDRFVYEVTHTEIVSATDYWVVTTRNPDIAELTLTSCHPKYTARDRIVVHSVLVPEKSSNVGFPTFYELDGDDDAEQIPGDDPTIGTDDTGPDDTTDATSTDATDENTDDDGTTNGGEAGGGDDGETGPPAEPADTAPSAADGAPAEAFSQGWFDDRSAFGHVALWGLALALVSLLIHQVSKRYRRWAVGIAVGVLPFLVALYFFYQNVNRLLPPGL